MTGQAAAGESPVVPFLRAGPPPDRTRWEGWQQWRAGRGSFIPAPRLSLAEYQALSPRGRALHDLHRTATHVNLRLQETPMSGKVSGLMRGRLQNNAVKLAPGTRDGLMISGGGFQGKTETACWAAAEFEDLWRGIHRQLTPGPVPGTRDLFVPVAYCRLPVRATPKALCKTILDVYGDPHPATLHDLVRSVRDAVRDHATTALLIDDVTRLRLHRGDDQDTLDLIRELMDLNVTLVLTGVGIPGSGLLRGAHADPRTRQWTYPFGGSHHDAAAAQTGRRFDLVELDPVGHSTPAGINAFLEHLGVPSLDIGFSGPYGVYHSRFDDFDWMEKFGDPSFRYSVAESQIYGTLVMRLADSDLLPLDYWQYGQAIQGFLRGLGVETKNDHPGVRLPTGKALRATRKFTRVAGELRRRLAQVQEAGSLDPETLHEVNQDLLQVERNFLLDKGLPRRPWFRHAFFAPGVYTGYAAVILPGVREALDRNDFESARRQLDLVQAAIERGTRTLSQALEALSRPTLPRTAGQ